MGPIDYRPAGIICPIDTRAAHAQNTGTFMEQSLNAMRAALRVLTALNEKRHPAAVDVDALRVYAGPQPQGSTLDEFACAVIQQAIERRARVRSFGAGQ